MKTRLRYKKTLLAAAIAATLATGAGMPEMSWAQTADATLRGKTAANAEVVAKNVATGVTRRTKAAEDGSYTLPGLQPGTYRVDAGPGNVVAGLAGRILAGIETLALSALIDVPAPA